MTPHPTAIGYIPASDPHNGKFAARVIDYARNQGYRFVALIGEWPIVEAFLADHRADLVVMPSGTYGVATDEITQPLNRPAQLQRKATTARFPPPERTGPVCAVIYLPDGTPIDGPDAQRCLAHIEARGYELVGITHTRAEIGQLFRCGGAAVAVLARREHWDPEWEPRIEVADEEPFEVRPRPLPKQQNAGRAHRRDRRPRIID